MPRKDFLEDLHAASVPGIFPRLSDVVEGGEDGAFSFTYTPPFSTQRVYLQATTIDTCAYPKYHQFFVFSDGDIPASIATTLSCYHPLDGCPRIEEFLISLSRSLDQAILGLEESSASADECDNDDYMGEDEDWDTEHETFPLSKVGPSSPDVLRSDLRAVKSAGYKVGVLGDIRGSVIVCISCRIGKLGISEQALQAWHVEGSEYLTLLLRYPLGYVPMSQIMSQGPQTPDTLVQMHVGVCKSYKPSLTCALQQFVSTQELDRMTGSASNAAHSRPKSTYRCLQIAESLNNLLKTHFLRLLRFRIEHGFSWAGAETYLHTAQGECCNSQVLTRHEYFAPDNWSIATPRFLMADHLADNKEPDALVFPLIAMQFVLRRFVKCTEFCLNCYRKVDFGFEAIKPYVCSNGLCLYQYMHLGMGPSVEWEILSQPYVVDLLISFTWCSAKSKSLEEFPCGIGLRVPTGKMRKARFDQDKMEITVEPSCEVRAGDWVCMMLDDKTSTTVQWHCEVQDTILFPHIKLSTPVQPSNRSIKIPGLVTGNIRYEIYDKDFDALSATDKCTSIATLLNTLPAVDVMQDYITNGGLNNVNRALSSWHDRVSPAALYVLRWVIASNRSCILYDDEPEDKVSGMPGYFQFRFAQGAPDKEARFVQAVKQGNSQYPTLFAWHGSSLQNWHSILREGLHFKKVAHGRSCGNGVYMSPVFGTSLGYTGYTGYDDPVHGTATHIWPQSKLNIGRAISLNEVVNAPQQFVHDVTCYVVQHLDWIQPRYLFVGPTPKGAKVCQGNPSRVYRQDPKRLIKGVNGENVKIPISAVTTHKANVSIESGKSKEPRKKGGEAHASFCDTDSVATLEEDRQLLRDSDNTDEDDELLFQIDFSKTDFRPGTLEVSSLRLLGPPRYATTTATKALHKRLQEILKVQKREPLHELGWYVDPNLVNNVYQWIVELHSFDPKLPLAKDLKKAKIQSIVFEIRFPPHFPMSPPFVRIIRPRILSFGRGGGGHVTLGGSMCMELLTNSGWSAACSMESVLLQVRLALSNKEPQPARLDTSTKADYAVGNAISDYKRVCQLHGWVVPDDLQEVSW